MGVKYLLIDANNALHRCHYAQGLTDSKGRRVSGVFGIMKMCRSLIRKFNPKYVIVAWDKGKSQERISVYPEYKAHRDGLRSQEDIDAIVRQKKICQNIFSNLPVRQLALEGIEADDVIGILCEKLKGTKLIVSNDQDFVQLVSDEVHLYLPNKETVLTDSTVEKFIGFPVKHYILWKSLVGDKSDNIRGIFGIGPKKATVLILNGLRGGKKPKISKDEQAILDRNKYLIAIGALLQKEQISKIMKMYRKEKGRQSNFELVRSMFLGLGFKSLFVRFDDWSSSFRKLVKKNHAKTC